MTEKLKLGEEVRGYLITADKVTMETGGGAATVTELRALEHLFPQVSVISRKDITPERYGQPVSPFLEDYFALRALMADYEHGKIPALAHLYSGSFSATVRFLHSLGAKVTYMVPAHDRHISIEEFGGPDQYPWVHIKDDDVFHLYTEGMREADLVLTQAAKSIPILVKDVGVDEKKIRVVPGGIIVPEDEVVKPFPKMFRVAYLGAAGPDKGLIYLIKAWAKLNYKDAELVLAGAGTEQFAQAIPRMVNSGQFVVMGRIPDVDELYNGCQVYVQPSATEGFALEIPEAMSYGRLVIASEGAGAAEIITDGKDGMRVPARDVDALARAIAWAREHPAEIREIGRAARETARGYTWAESQRKYEECFREVLDAPL